MMIANLKPYPAMKDSGVPWLGEAPEYWEVRATGAWSCNNLYTARPDDGNGLAAILANHGMTFHNYKDD